MPCPAWLTRGFVNRALRRQSSWDLGNQTLYDLCRRHPGHHRHDEIVAKIWLIGRTYAATIERGRGQPSVTGDDFYVDTVAPSIRRARIDRWLAPLARLRRPEPAMVVPAHARLTKLFAQIAGQEKRSLASKYLHFHFPRAVYIYDDRVSRGIRRVSPAQHLREMPFTEFDDTYGRFYLRCRRFHQELEQVSKRPLTPREVDKVLLAVAERER